MQLTKKITLYSALSAATGVLLGATHAQANKKNEKDWSIASAVLFYNEQDRVQAIEPKIHAKKTFRGDRNLNVNLVLDSLTGASPNGAAPSDQPQTFTRPSGEGDFEVAAGEIPLDDTFQDTRAQIGINWDAPLNRLTRYNVGTNISKEYDYTSIMISGGLSRDFYKRNTTLSANIAYAFDSLSPEGGVPTPKSAMAPAGSPQARDGKNESKKTADLAIGLTQIINARSIMQINVGISQADGYLNDPFKVVSVVESNGRPIEHIYELRPNSRRKNYIYWDTKHHFNSGNTLDFSYRVMRDNWGVNSNTIDIHYRWNITNQVYLEPHVRFYQQTAADFYRSSVHISNKLTEEYLSADYRLGKFEASTFGIKLNYKLMGQKSINMRIERYQQTGTTQPGSAIGIQNNFERYPDLAAIIFQLGYVFKY